MVDIGSQESRTQIGVRVGIVRVNPYGLAEFADGFLVLIILSQHQPYVVVRLRIVRPESYRFAKLFENLRAVRTFAAEQES